MKVGFVLALAVLTACSRTVPVPERVSGEPFPAVEGTSLEGKPVRVPGDFRGEPVIVIVGYEQRAQFDIDRWVLGILDSGISAKVMELPTISGLLPTVIRSRIDEGMKRGIPEEVWPSVATVYDDSDKIEKAIGRTNPKNAQVLVLDREGRIRWFQNRGYAPHLVRELRALIGGL